MHISKMKFRSPVPHHFLPRGFDLEDFAGQRIDEVAITKVDLQILEAWQYIVWYFLSSFIS